MQPKKEFRRYSEECQSMSALSKDPETKALWQGMAERWTLCAKLTEQEDGSVVRSKKEAAQTKRRIPQNSGRPLQPTVYARG